MIKAGDFKCPCDACKLLGAVAPGITDELAMKLNMMEALCAHHLAHPGYKLAVTSGRRCAVHNAAIGGAPDSQHLTGVAADLFADESESRYALVAAATTMGLPFVEVAPNHVHVDLRPSVPPRLIMGAG